MSGGDYTITGYHNRHSLRLRGYDYSQPGAYFITLCINDHTQRLFGRVEDGNMIKSPLAEIVANCWNGLPGHFPCISLDESIIMPDHFHGIVVIRCPLVGVGFPDPEFPKADDRTVGAGFPDPEFPKADDRTVGVGFPDPEFPKADNCAKGVGFPDPEFPKADDRAKGRDDRAPTLGSIMAYFKYQTTKQINAYRHCGICKIWQRNFYDHIIRDEKSCYYIRDYIKNNPSNWQINVESHLEKEIREFERWDTVESEQSKFSKDKKTGENGRFGEKSIL